MKTKKLISTAAGVLLLVMAAGPALGQSGGSLPPPGPPGQSMASLKEIWNTIKTQDSQIESLQTQLSELTAFLGAPMLVEMVAVGNPGNLPDQDYGSGAHGAVSYPYRIGKYEVSNAQYAQFLNAVAKTADSNGLHSTNMGQDPRGGITRTGPPGSFTYAVRPFMVDKPVNFVNWFSAARYCNWLHNGRPTGAQGQGTTEDGAYTLTGPTTIQLPGTDPTHGANGRNVGAKFHLPGEDEWYKAAYHQPASEGGDADDYWFYPTRSNSNSPPTVATADSTGSINNDTDNIANYADGADWNQLDGNVTKVGSGGPGSASYYGGFDMGGNVAEWTEEIASPTERVTRGGSWDSFLSDLGAPVGFDYDCFHAYLVGDIGFRVAGP